MKIRHMDGCEAAQHLIAAFHKAERYNQHLFHAPFAEHLTYAVGVPDVRLMY